VVILWTHCRGQAAEREEKRNSPVTEENRGPEKTKNSTIEASMLLKTKKCMSRTKLKRTQNEPQLSAQMREIEPNFELIDIARVGAGVWTVGDGAGTEITRLVETQGSAREYNNSGNEAKKCVKTKHITFLSAANQAPLARQSAQIRP